ncbi:golgi apparatus protein 1-like protein [Dermatophagoides farinae]|uniref:Golgi apparatus protein 1-like protein n=1 Tax=Dermatophagoides farinae TaxID=6954 RepID=A0A9D4NVK7_DERFA|nr:golgi apparatus protein 1-like protein [Dermatophagoides farinae]
MSNEAIVLMKTRSEVKNAKINSFQREQLISMRDYKGCKACLYWPNVRPKCLHRRFLFENYKPNTRSALKHTSNDIYKDSVQSVNLEQILSLVLKEICKKLNMRGVISCSKVKISSKFTIRKLNNFERNNIAEDVLIQILSCLAEHIDSPEMAEECRESLNQMQYFVDS